MPIDHLHYDVIRAKPDGSCRRPAETGPSVFVKMAGNKRASPRVRNVIDEHRKNNVAHGGTVSLALRLF